MDGERKDIPIIPIVLEKESEGRRRAESAYILHGTEIGLPWLDGTQFLVNEKRKFVLFVFSVVLPKSLSSFMIHLSAFEHAKQKK